MAKKAKSAAIPRLRFPEFREAGPWDLRKLSHFLQERKQRNRDLKFGPSEVLSVSGDHGCVNQIELLGRSYAGVSVKEYHVVETGDLVYTKSPLKKNPYGIIRENKGKPGIVSTLYAVYSATEIGHPAYLDHYFSRDYNLNSYLQPIVRKGAKNDMKVNNAAVLSGEVLTPKLPEQVKIAACLTSLDRVITAQRRKVEALKAYKRGLMQQLFPHEGETLPRRRFPEFRGGPEWRSVTLNEVIEVTSGQVNPTQPPYCDLPHVGGENIASHTGNLLDIKTARELLLISGKYPFDKRDILYSKIRPALNKVALPAFEGICSADIYPIRPSGSELSRVYLLYLLRSGDFLAYAIKHSERSKIPKINREALLAYVTLIPSLAEQKRIAACLSSLDAMITAASRLLDSLRVHKKGLMQQLFVSVQEAA